MDVYQAVAQRRSARAFLPRAVDHETIQRVLQSACQAPSGGNLQPWHLFVLTGEPLREVITRTTQRITHNAEPDPPDYPIYPPKLLSPYRDRRFGVGEQMYAALGVGRDDDAGRRRQFLRNFEFFGAPVGLFCYLHRQMGPAQWPDLGMYLQTVMLLLEAEGLGSCPQAAWSQYHRTVAEVVSAPEQLMLFCGMSIGYPDPDHPLTSMRTQRAPLCDVSTFMGWDG
jgi:nitroreductase